MELSDMDVKAAIINVFLMFKRIEENMNMPKKMGIIYKNRPKQNFCRRTVSEMGSVTYYIFQEKKEDLKS